MTVFRNSHGSNATLDELCREHREIERLLEACLARSGPESRHAERVMELCHAMRLHYTVETGLFLPAVAQECGDADLLERGALEYAAVLELINELGCPNSDNRDPHGELEALDLLFGAHVEAAESNDGIFPRAATMTIDWVLLGHRMAARRVELAGQARSALRFRPHLTQRARQASTARCLRSSSMACCS